MRRLRTAVAVTTLAAIACVVIAIGASSASTSAAKAATAPAPPTVTTGSATSTGPSSETVNGVVNPNGQPTHYYVVYGTSTSYTNSTGILSAASGTTPLPVSFTLTGLVPGTLYHYQLNAVTASGTTAGADETFTTPQTTSQVRVMGREGFVSPGRIIGVELGCFAGQTTCAGHIALTHDGVVVGERDFSIPPESGGFHNLQLTTEGERLLGNNRVFHLLGVRVTVTVTGGPTLNYVIHLARWVWH